MPESDRADHEHGATIGSAFDDGYASGAQGKERTIGGLKGGSCPEHRPNEFVTRVPGPLDERREEGSMRGSPRRGLQRVFVPAVLVMIAAVGIAAFLVGSSLRSPAQEAAKARAPRPSVVTVPVSYERARTQVVLRATLAESATTDVGVPTDLTGTLPVVSALDKSPGDEVLNGSFIAAVAGRPVIALAGRVPAYADMQVGAVGVNVAELQGDLVALGYGIGTDRAGVYEPGTASAVAGLYRSTSYPPIMASSDAISPKAGSRDGSSSIGRRRPEACAVRHRPARGDRVCRGPTSAGRQSRRPRSDGWIE